jgi:hypothetical protein
VEEGFAAPIAGTAGATPPGLSTEEAFTFHVGLTGLADGYFKDDLPWYAERAAQLDDQFLRPATTATQELEEREVFVPWLGFAMSAAGHDAGADAERSPPLQVSPRSATGREGARSGLRGHAREGASVGRQ